MKKGFLVILALTLIFGMAIVGCDDGDDNGNGNNGNEGIQVYNQDGTVFTGNDTGTIWYASGFRETERGNNAVAANINITNGKIDGSFEGDLNITVGWNCLVISMNSSIVSNSKVNNFNDYKWIIIE